MVLDGSCNGAGWFLPSLAQVEQWSYLGMKGNEQGQVTESSGNGLVGPSRSNPRSHHKSENDFPVTAQARQAVYKSHTVMHTGTELYISYI